MICQEGLTQKGFFFSPGCTSVAAFIQSMISTSAFQCLAMLCLLGCMMVLYNFLDLYFPTGNWRIVKFRKSNLRFRDIPPFLQGCERTVFWRPSGRGPMSLSHSWMASLHRCMPSQVLLNTTKSRVKEWLSDRRQGLSVAASFPMAVPRWPSPSRFTIPFPSHRTFSFPEYGGPTVFIAHHAQVSPGT